MKQEPSGHRVGEAVRLRRVVVVRKTTPVEQLARSPDRKLASALASGDPLGRRVQRAHDEHVHTADVVVRALTERGVEFQVVSRFGVRHAAWADLVVTVGGDGTFLRASHSVLATATGDGTPMLGVNSAAGSSLGYFCAASHDDFAQVLDQIGRGELHSRGLWRMQVSLNGKPLRDLALNDMLLAHGVPAETSRYRLRVGDQEQDQKSSGIWIATAAGSTAAIRSAGGQVIDLDARQLQYRVRELMRWAVKGEPLIGGLLGNGLELVSRMSTGMLFIDGGHKRVQIGFGDRLTLASSERPMPWVAPPALDQRRAMWLN